MRWGGRLLSAFAAAFATSAVLLAHAQAAVAQGGYTGAYFDPASGSFAYTGAESDGTSVTFPLQLDVARLLEGIPFVSDTAPPGEAYLDIPIEKSSGSDASPQVTLGFYGIPTSDVTLLTGSGSFPIYQGVNAASGGLFYGDMYFLVPDTITSATLQVAASNVGDVIDENSGSDTTLSFPPLAMRYTIETVPATSPSGSADAPTRTATPTSLAVPARGGTSNGVLAVELAGTAGGVTFFVIFLPILVNRRAYARATEKGTVVIGAPPTPDPPPPATPTEAPPQPQDETEDLPHHAKTILVRLFGEHDDVEGLRAPIGQGPREVLDFLVAHPGTEWSSARLRAAIWRDPRPDITPETLRNYLTSLRKALPPGALVTSDRGRQHRLTGVVQGDWGLICAYVDDQSGDRVSSLVAALKLVRGRPFVWAESAENGAYGWAVAGVASHMERAAEKAAKELVGLGLETHDLETAKFAVDAGLRATSFSEALERDALRIASARGGKAGLRQAMAEARARLGEDVERIESFARELGWSGW